MKNKQNEPNDTLLSPGKLGSYEGFKKFWPFLKPYILLTILGILLTIPVGALDAVVASFLKPFMDNVMVEKNSEFAMKVPFIIIGFTLVQGFCIYSSNIVNSYVGARISTDLKLTLYEKLLKNDASFYDTNTSGIVLQRFSSDAECATTGLISNVKLFLSKFWSSLGLVCVLLYNSWQLSFIALGVLIFLLLPMKIARKKLMSITTLNVKALTKINSNYIETYSGVKVIKSFNLQDTLFSKFKSDIEMVLKFTMKIVRDTNWLSPAMHLVTATGVAGVLYYGMYLITTGVITSGTFVAFLAALIMLYTPIKSIGNNYISLQTSLLALERIYSILDGTGVEEHECTSKKLDKIKDSLEFSKVCFSYDGSRQVLNDISFKIKVGQKVALVGNSGGGKSTICSLIPRLYENTKGEILIDGVNVKEYTIKSLRENIAMVFQDNFLFDTTIKENLLFGKKDATDEELTNAIKGAYLDEFVDGLPQGLDTCIGERGLLLSGGQKQRVAIARAILKNAPIVILDEATSALDNKSEKIVQRALDKLMEGRTTIVIAHRLSTILDADIILVVNDGQIVEMGNHSELIQKQGAYYTLYNMQFSKQLKDDDITNEY